MPDALPGKLGFGYLSDFRNPALWQRPWAQVSAEILDFAAWSETAGFSGAWVPEHHGASDGYIPSPMVALAAIAARTKTLKLGSAVALAPLHHPVRFAEDCAVLDILSGGRLEMTLAIGYRKRETAAFGVDFTKRGGQFGEFLEIVRRLWAGETVTLVGKHFTITDAAISPLSPRGQIPLFIGGFADKALDRVVKYADGYSGDPGSAARYIAKLAASGRDPASARVRSTELFLVVARDPAAAMDELAPYYHYVNTTYGAWMNEDKALGMESGMGEMDIETFKASGILTILTPGEAIDKFASQRQTAPLEHVILMLPPGIHPERFKPYAEVLAQEVIPAFA